MKSVKERMANISSYLQRLMEPAIYPEVKEAVEKEDKDLLINACKKAKIPAVYFSIIVPLLLSVVPQQLKWPLVE